MEGGGGEERVNRTVPWSAKTNASYQFGSLPSRSSFLQMRSLNSGLRRLTTLTQCLQNSAVAYHGRCVYMVKVCHQISCMFKKIAISPSGQSPPSNQKTNACCRTAQWSQPRCSLRAFVPTWINSFFVQKAVT